MEGRSAVNESILADLYSSDIQRYQMEGEIGAIRSIIE